MKPSHHRIIPNWLLLVCAIVLIFSLGYLTWFYCVKPESTETANTPIATTNANSTNTTATKDWKTYTNSTLGLTLKYPKNWYYFENNSAYNSMCEAEFKNESSSNTFSSGEKCIDKNLVVEFSIINGFCTKGGCVDPNLKNISNPVKLQLIGITELTDAQKDNIISDSSSKKYTSKDKIIDGVNTKVYYFENDPQTDGIMSNVLVWTLKGKNYKLWTATETGTETAEKTVFDNMINSIVFSK